jgi:hypothetical protein
VMEMSFSDLTLEKDISSKIRISKLSSLKFVACMSKLYKNIQI